MAAGPDFRPKAAPISRSSDKSRPRERLEKQNRLLALLLAGIAALALCAAITVAVLLHYAELHHLFSNR
ncbi:MAG TPA: hypothetical protein VGR45_17195 [Stellaceae bacterium]|nr:hypothetical protein [Stellaceae bacterium]